MTEARKAYGGRYAVMERVGTGGMAEVYRARDELLGRDVAVKVLSERFSRDRSFVERFRREAQSAANLNHPNIVSLYDYGSDDGTYFIVMEYIDGKPLSEVITGAGPLMPERAVEIASDVALALDRAHQAGLVHRDIKPGNIMINSTGETKVTDFGIARALHRTGDQSVTQTGMVMGTAGYLSPEQAQGKPVDARSDVYALGCVLYEMLAGRPPFSGETPLAVAYKHVREDPRPPSEMNPDVPPALDAITLKALAKNPDDRFSSAAEMREDMQRFLHGQTVQAGPPLEGATAMGPVTRSRTEVLERPAYAEPAQRRRRPAWYVLVALGILLLFGLLAWLLLNTLLGTQQVTVPDLVGRNVDEAREMLEDEGLDADVIRESSPRPPDEVIAQEPAAGQSVDEGGTVRLTVSSGPRQVQVPDVEGLSLDEARQQIREAGLRVGETTQQSSDEDEAGTVLDQDPDPNEQVDEGTRIDLIVSSGPELVTVPSVVGQTEGSARNEIEGAGLQANVSRRASNEEEGTVIAQEPEAGAEVERDTTVTIVVSQGPQERPMPDVTGQEAGAARRRLENDYGLRVSVQQADESCGQQPNTVCEQNPDPGRPVSEGDRATLFVEPRGGTGQM